MSETSIIRPLTEGMIFDEEPQNMSEAKQIIRALRHRAQGHRKVKAKSGYRGVYFHRYSKARPWKAYYRQHGEVCTIGYFATKEDAARAYNEAVKGFTYNKFYLNPV